VLEPDPVQDQASARTRPSVHHLAEIRRASRTRRARLRRAALVTAVGGSTAILGVLSMPAAVLAAPALTTLVVLPFRTPRRVPSIPIPRRGLLAVTEVDLVVASHPQGADEVLGRRALRIPRAHVARVAPGDRLDEMRIECADGTVLSVAVSNGDRGDLIEAIGRLVPQALRANDLVSPVPSDGRRAVDRLP